MLTLTARKSVAGARSAARCSVCLWVRAPPSWVCTCLRSLLCVCRGKGLIPRAVCAREVRIFGGHGDGEMWSLRGEDAAEVTGEMLPLLCLHQLGLSWVRVALVEVGKVRASGGPRCAHHFVLPVAHRCPCQLRGPEAAWGLRHHPGDQVCLSGLGQPEGHHHPRA